MAYEFWVLLYSQEEPAHLGNFSTIDQGRNYWRMIAGGWPRADRVDDSAPAYSEEELVRLDDARKLELDHESQLAGFQLRQIPNGNVVYRGDFSTDEC